MRKNKTRELKTSAKLRGGAEPINLQNLDAATVSLESRYETEAGSCTGVLREIYVPSGRSGERSAESTIGHAVAHGCSSLEG